jgi:hypothetical protein
MRILIYLRRALAGRAAGVGGPPILTNANTEIQSEHEHGFQSRVFVHSWRQSIVCNSVYHAIESRVTVNQLGQRLGAIIAHFLGGTVDLFKARDFHFASLAERSSKRHRPFVPVFAGGNS